MPDYVPPGAPPAGAMDVNPDSLHGFATRADIESRSVGALLDLDAVTTVEATAPGAQLINGCIVFRQTVEPLITGIHDGLGQLYLGIHAGIASITEADVENAARVAQAGGR